MLGGTLPRCGYKSYSGFAGSRRPVASSQIRDGEQRFPYVGVAVFDTVRHRRPAVFEGVGGVGPVVELVGEFVGVGTVDATTPRFNVFVGGAAAHTDDDAARHEGVGQVV
jgi:hypothetical protein